jgi:ABC-2 type transport system ATP-binding protein
MIQVRELKKTFKGNIHAIQGISFEVPEGEFFAFLGPNGAGKSTTIQIVTTLRLPTEGEVKVAGYDVVREPEAVRQRIGVALQETGIDPGLTGRELLELQAKLFGFSGLQAKKRTDELLELIHLTEDAGRKVGNYSGGMRRRLDLALSLVHRPKILFLDEPTTGLDPYNRMAIWEELRLLNQEHGTTIFLTTQYLEEADQLADRIEIINKGKIVASGTPTQLKQLIGKDVIELQFTDHRSAQRAEAVLTDHVKETRVTDGKLTVFVANGPQQLADIVRLLDAAESPPQSLTLSPPSLDDVFLQVTGEAYQTSEAERKSAYE